MGIDYEAINRCEQFEYETFIPSFLSVKKKINEDINKNGEPKINDCSELSNSNLLRNFTNNSILKKNSTISKSRKSTFDNDDIESEKNNSNPEKSSDKFKTIFTQPDNSPFYAPKKEEIIYNKNKYFLEINEKDDIRKRYYSKLIYKNIWTPGMKSKSYSSIFIFDWDDTLFPTTFLVDENIIHQNNISIELQKIISMLEEIVINILNYAVNKGDVYIITNSSIAWFEYSSNKFFPKLKNLLEKINIISARDDYEFVYPGENKLWKEKAFLNLKTKINNSLVNNIICFGDSLIELEAGKVLASKLNNSFYKAIKFKENPEIEDLIKQLNLIVNQLDFIYSKAKNLSITIEQKY